MKRITLEEAKHYRKLTHDADLTYSMSQATAFTLEPDPDNPKFDLVTYYSEIRGGLIDANTGDYAHPHYVYVLTNMSMPGIVKIGYTERNVHDRLKEINTSTSAIIPWEIGYSYKCPNGRMLEGEVHSHLESLGLRPNKKREGFLISVDDAISIIEQLGAKYQKSI